MNDKLYFLLGDLASNLVTGVLTALLCMGLISLEWNMFVAMLIGMLLGMLLALILGLALLFRYFGANEVMVPTMLTGMLVGMVVGMIEAMHSVPSGLLLLLGAMLSLTTLFFCNLCDYLIREVYQIQKREQQEQ